MKTTPKFASEAEEQEFWDTVPDISEYFNFDSARGVRHPHSRDHRGD